MQTISNDFIFGDVKDLTWKIKEILSYFLVTRQKLSYGFQFPK